MPKAYIIMLPDGVELPRPGVYDCQQAAAIDAALAAARPAEEVRVEPDPEVGASVVDFSGRFYYEGSTALYAVERRR